MRLRIALLLAAAAAAPSARAAPADDYFEIGVDYLSKGFFSAARAAFAESLVRAPRQPVPLALLGVASAAEGRPARETADLLRAAHRHLPEGRDFEFDLRELLPEPKTVRLVQGDWERRLKKAKGRPRRDCLAVLGFLQHHDGTPGAPAWNELRKAAPDDPILARQPSGKPRRERSLP